MLDSLLLGRWATVEEQPQLYHDVINGNGQEDLAEMLSMLCGVCNIVLRNSEFEDIIQTGISFGHIFSFTSLTLSWLSQPLSRVCASRTDQCLARKSGLVRAPATPEAHDAQEFDRLCLALGLLTNLVQVNEESKDLCRETSTLYSLLSVIVPSILYRTRSLMSGSPSVRVRVQLSQRRQCATVLRFRL